eukprot:COSAG01_NODE_208_length_21996_cov_31.972097_6_plen_170_part_00
MRLSHFSSVTLGHRSCGSCCSCLQIPNVLDLSCLYLDLACTVGRTIVGWPIGTPTDAAWAARAPAGCGRARAAAAGLAACDAATAMGSGSGPASEGSSPTAVPSSGGGGAGGALLTSCTALALGAVGCGVWGLVRRAVRSRAASTRASELLVCRPAVSGRGRWPAAYRS